MKDFQMLQKDGSTKTISLYGVKEAAGLLNVSYPTLIRWVKNKAIKASRLGRAYYLSKDEIIRIQNECLQGKNIGESNE